MKHKLTCGDCVHICKVAKRKTSTYRCMLYNQKVNKSSQPCNEFCRSIDILVEQVINVKFI